MRRVSIKEVRNHWTFKYLSDYMNIFQFGTYVSQHDRVRATINKLHLKFFQNPFLEGPWFV